jgi:hypothetical protein
MSLRLLLHNNKSTTETILMKFCIGEFTTFYRRVPICGKNKGKIKYMLHVDARAFSADLETNSLNIYRRETLVDNKAYRRINHMFYFQI